jgi:argininosuccinate synthase
LCKIKRIGYKAKSVKGVKKMNKKEKVILAYSGGLDTSVILKWLIEKGYEVICYCADVGQDDDFQAMEAKALKIGASKVYVEDLKAELVTDYVFPAIKANLIYEGKYLLGTALARPLIAKKHVEIAQKEKAKYISHGATGKGNDQVRFEMTYYALDPHLLVLTPWREPEFLAQFSGRTDLIAYSEENHIPISQTLKKPYSEDDNLIHISHEAGVIEDPAFIATEDVFSKTVSPKNAPDKETIMEIHFEKGVPTQIINQNDHTKVTNSLELFEYANTLGAANGIGREDMVENRFIGLKSRGIYETPGLEILRKAHLDLEGLTIDKEVLHLKEMLMPKLAEIVYYGFWFSSEYEFLTAAFNQSQKTVSGVVTLSLYKGNVTILKRTSPYSLYNQSAVSMDEIGDYDPTDAKGFIKIHALRLREYAKINKLFEE